MPVRGCPVPEHFLGNHPSFEIFLTSAFYEAEIHCYHFSLSPEEEERLKDCFCLRTFFWHTIKRIHKIGLYQHLEKGLKMKHLRCRVFHPKTSRKDDAHRLKVEAGVTDLLCNKAKKERRWWSWTHITWRRRGPRRRFFQSWWFRRDFARCGWCQKCTHSFVLELWNTHVCTDKPHYTLYHFHMWTSKVGNDWLRYKKRKIFLALFGVKSLSYQKKDFQRW